MPKPKVFQLGRSVSRPIDAPKARRTIDAVEGVAGLFRLFGTDFVVIAKDAKTTLRLAKAAGVSGSTDAKACRPVSMTLRGEKRAK